MDIYTNVYCVSLIFIRSVHLQGLKAEQSDFNKKKRLAAQNIACGIEYGSLVQNMQIFDHDIRINGLNK